MSWPWSLAASDPDILAGQFDHTPSCCRRRVNPLFSTWVLWACASECGTNAAFGARMKNARESLARPERAINVPAQPVKQPSSVDFCERIARFEASVARLDSNRRDFARRRPRYTKSFLALTLAGFACFAFGGYVGLWGSLSASVVSLAGYGMLQFRVKELTSEIDGLQREVKRMRTLATRAP